MADAKILNPLYQDLIHEIKEDNDQQILKISDNILSKVPNENDVLACKIIALLKLSKFDQVTPLFEKDKNNIKSIHPILPFAYCYYLYKIGKYDDCINEIKKHDLKNDTYKTELILLLAQSKYKLGFYNESSELYLSILQNRPVDQQNIEILVNFLNSSILDDSGNYHESALKLADAYISKFGGDLLREFFFNVSLLHTHIMNLKSAVNYLNRFKQVMDQESKLEGNDAADEDNLDNQTDLLMYNIQLDYINSFQYEYTQEELDKHINKYTQILEKKIDEYYKILVQNNLVCMKAGMQKEISDSLRKLDEIINKTQNNQNLKFTKAQILAFKTNKLILYLSKSKYSESLKLIEDIEKAYEPIEYYGNQKYLSCKFYLLFKTKKYKEIEQLSNNAIETITKSSLKPNVKSAMHSATILINGEIDRLIGNQKQLVFGLQSLYTVDKNFMDNDVLNALILTIITKNFNIFSDFKPTVNQILTSSKNPQIMALVAELYIKDKLYPQAIEIYESLNSMSNGQNVQAIERLCYLYSLSDWKKAQEYLNLIPQVEIITDSNELRRLENDFLPSKSSKLIEESKADMNAKTKKIKKRKRKPRYPKGFDPANPTGTLDKERWLPLMERTKFKKLAAKKGILRGPQGATAGKETMSTFKSGPSTANQEVASSKNVKSKKKR